MPTYEYACTACGHRLDAVQKFTDDPLTECPECGGALRKVYGAVGIVLKGSGFYKNDSRAAAGSNGSGKKSAESPERRLLVRRFVVQEGLVGRQGRLGTGSSDKGGSDKGGSDKGGSGSGGTTRLEQELDAGLEHRQLRKPVGQSPLSAMSAMASV